MKYKRVPFKGPKGRQTTATGTSRVLFIHLDGDPVYGHADYCARWDLMSDCTCESRKVVFKDKDTIGEPC